VLVLLLCALEPNSRCSTRVIGRTLDGALRACAPRSSPKACSHAPKFGVWLRRQVVLGAIRRRPCRRSSVARERAIERSAAFLAELRAHQREALREHGDILGAWFQDRGAQGRCSRTAERPSAASQLRASLPAVERVQPLALADRRKSTIYARSNVPEYWLVDVDNQRVEVRTQPDGGAYLRQETVPCGGELQSSSLPELNVSGARIFAG
jgi:hypothetical protein